MKSLADLQEFLRSYPYRKRFALAGIYLIVEALRRHYHGDQTAHGLLVDATVVAILLSNPKKRPFWLFVGLSIGQIIGMLVGMLIAAVK